MSARFKVVGNHIVDTWGGGVIVGELAGQQRAKTVHPRRRTRQAQAQTVQDFILAAGVVLGLWLSFVVMP